VQISIRIVDAEPLVIGVRDFVVNTKHRDRLQRLDRVHDFHDSVTFRLKVSLHWQEHSAVIRPPNSVRKVISVDVSLCFPPAHDIQRNHGKGSRL
jgi:hypothetical protein